MKVPVVEVNGFTVVGLEYFGDNKLGEIASLWPVFNEREEEVENKIADGSYGVCSEMDEKGNFSYVCCVKVSKLDEIPQGMVTKVVPQGKYGVFTFTGDLSNLQAFYGNIYQNWLAENKFELDMRPDFEHYDRRFMEDGTFDIYIPIK